MERITRSKNETLFGFPSPLPLRQLPTTRNIINSYHFYRRILPGNSNQHLIATRVAQDVMSIWERAGLYTISEASIVNKVRTKISSAKIIVKIPFSSRNTESFFNQIEFTDQLFDVSTCKCFDSSIDRKLCKCPVKIPLCEYPFYVDQKTERLQLIGGVDMKMTENMQDRTERKLAQQQRIDSEHESQKKRCLDIEIDEILDPVGIQEINVLEDPTFQLNDLRTVQSTQNRYSYQKLAATADRFRSSNREVVALVNAALMDLNLITSEVTLTCSKLHRERKKARVAVVRKSVTERNMLSCVMFDGRRDRTFTYSENENNKLLKSIEMEEHISILAEPGSYYVDHVTPETGKAKDIAQEILSVLSETDSICSLIGVGCDGCATNTGKNSGIIRRLELSLDRPLQWMICMLHLNELPFRHLFAEIDGPTSGPKSFIGDIGKELSGDLRQLPIAKFQKIEGSIVDIPQDILAQLSTDQLYLYQMGMSVQRGASYLEKCGFANKSPGEIHHARWLTRANRTLRLFISKSNPSEHLKSLVYFIVAFYIPGWFHIRQHSMCTEGAKNFFKLIQLSRNLSPGCRGTVENVLQRNGYWAHVENILLTAFFDENSINREYAVHKILEARKRNEEQDYIRTFKPPSINFGADNYLSMVDWQSVQITSPPLLQHLSNQDILNAVEFPLNNLYQYPCHTQAVERVIQVVTQASSTVWGHDERHGQILNTLSNRVEFPKFHSKSTFLV